MIAAKFKYALAILAIIVGCALIASGCQESEPPITHCRQLTPGLYEISAQLVEGTHCRAVVQYTAFFSESGVEQPVGDNDCHDVAYFDDLTCKVSAMTTCPDGFQLLYDIDILTGNRAEGTIRVTLEGKECTYMVGYRPVLLQTDAGAGQ